MNLKQELIRNFRSMAVGIRRLNTVEGKETCYTIKSHELTGVLVPNPNEIVINESFASVNITNEIYEIDGVPIHFFELSTPHLTLLEEFALICTQFLEFGEKGNKRRELQENPVQWWEKWQELLGNKIYNVSPRTLLSEMIALIDVLKFDKSANLGSFMSNTFDIESDRAYYEVKSTTVKYDDLVTINSQFQLNPNDNRPVYLIFIRMEASEFGTSLDSALEELSKLGYNTQELETHMYDRKMYKDSKSRKECYSILEKRIYTIDNDFPVLELNEKQRENIKKVTYTVDLTGIPFRDLFKE